MKFSDEKINHLSHIITDSICKSGLVDFESNELVLSEVKKIIIKYLKVEDEVDAVVQKRIKSYKRHIPVGSSEWEVLYSKFFSEEMKKRKR